LASIERALAIIPTSTHKLSVQFPVKIDSQSSGGSAAFLGSFSIVPTGTVTSGTYTISFTLFGTTYVTAAIPFDEQDLAPIAAMMTAYGDSTHFSFRGDFAPTPNLPNAPTIDFIAVLNAVYITSITIDSSSLAGGGSYSPVLNSSSLTGSTTDWQAVMSDGGVVGVGYDTALNKYRFVSPYTADSTLLAGFDISGSGPLSDNFHTIEFFFDYSTEPATVRVFIDGDIVAGVIISDKSVLPDHLYLQAHADTGNANTVEYDFGRIVVADGYIGTLGSIGGGATNEIDVGAIDNATETWIFWQVTDAKSNVSAWNAVQIASGGVVAYQQQVPVPVGAIFTNPPLGPLAVNNAEIRATVGGGTLRLYPKPAKTTLYGDSVDHLAPLGTMSIPGSARPDYSGYPSNGYIQIEGMSGASNFDTLALKGIVLFPMDGGADRWAQVVASADGLAEKVLWKIGVTRYGYCYAALWSTDGSTFLGFADVVGRPALHEGDNQLIIFAERQDTEGRWVADLTTLKFQLATRIVDRWHLGATPTL
jgi:hypothetical protein